MRVICIAGNCGSGKTTAIKIMEQYLPKMAGIRGDLFLKAALLNHAKEFEDIYTIPLDIEKPFNCFVRVSINASVEKYLQMFNAFIPFIENEIEKLVSEYKRQGMKFVIIEHITLPAFKIWGKADYRVMITAKKEFSVKKLLERIPITHGSDEEKFTLLSENALAGFSENASRIDFVIENNYDEHFEKDLVNLCKKIEGYMV